MLEDNDLVAQPTPSSQASPVFRRLRKGPRPQVTLSSVPEGEERQSVSRQVFPEASPTASADEQEEPREEERVATRPSNPEVVFEENVSDPPATRVEVENSEAATNTNTEANDVVMAEANVPPEATVALDVNVVPEVIAPEANLQPEANATATVPPPRPHTLEKAFYQG